MKAKRGRICDLDLSSLNKAISLVQLSERAPLYAKLAHAYALRHTPATSLAHYIQKGDIGVTLKENDNAVQSIFASREAIETVSIKADRVVQFRHCPSRRV